MDDVSSAPRAATTPTAGSRSSVRCSSSDHRLTALAATLEAAGVMRLATFKRADFKVFDFIEIVDPRRR